VSSNHLSRIVWDRIALTSQAADLQAQAVAFDGAARSRWPDAAAPSATWASTLIRACACGRIGSQVMWDLLLAHADASTPPDVDGLLEHLPEAHARPSLGELLDAALVLQEPSAAASPQRGTPTDPPRLGAHASASGAEHDDWFVMLENVGAA
jgi:hypothetical protein